jgi:hypothetical protein
MFNSSTFNNQWVNSFDSLSNEFCNYIFYLESSNTLSGYHFFELKFDSQINIDSIVKSISHLNSPKAMVYFPNRISYPDKVPNDITLVQNIEMSDAMYSPDGPVVNYYNPNLHKMGFGWHHYVVKTPLAWDITEGSNNRSIIANDIFEIGHPKPSPFPLEGNHPDLAYKESATEDGNWFYYEITYEDYINEDGFMDTREVIPDEAGDNPGRTTAAIYMSKHGMTVLPFAVAKSNNFDSSVPNGSMVGTCPNCFGIPRSISSVGGNFSVDTDFDKNDFIQVADVVNMSYGYNVTNQNITHNEFYDKAKDYGHRLYPSLEKGMIHISSQGNNLNPVGNFISGELISDINGVQTWGPTPSYPDGLAFDGDQKDDIKVISVAALEDGEPQSEFCDHWHNTCFECDGRTPKPGITCTSVRYTGELRFKPDWSYSKGTDKFNNSTDWETRRIAKLNSGVDLVAPAIAVYGLPGYNQFGQYVEYNPNINGTSQASPIVAGITGLMVSINKFMGVDLGADNYPVDGFDVQRKAYDILTFTADKLVDDGYVEPAKCGIAYPSVNQPEYVRQTNDRLKRWWAQRMGFGKVNAYRAVAHSIENKVPYEITSRNYSLPFANDDGNGDDRGYKSPEGEQLIHMGAFASEGSGASYPNDGFWEIPSSTTDRGPTTGDDGVYEVLDWGGSSIPFISSFHDNSDADLTNDHALYNNQGVTVLNNNESIKLDVANNQVLAIDGLLIGKPALAGHEIWTDLGKEEGKILVEGYIRDVTLAGNLRVGDLILDGSDEGNSVGASSLWFGATGTKSEVYGEVNIVNKGWFMGGGGHVTFYPGAEINLRGDNDVVMRWDSEWHMKGASSFSSTINRKLIVEGGSKLYIDEAQKVDLDLFVEVLPCGELIVEKDALLRIKNIKVHKGGTFTVNEGAKVTFDDPNHEHELLGNNNFNGTSLNPVTLRAMTEEDCQYDQDNVIGNAAIDVCNPVSASTSLLIEQITFTTITCNYPCPSNNDWLVLTSVKDGSCPNVDDCRVTHNLLMPQDYLCAGAFSHYKVTTTINAVQTVHSQTAIIQGQIIDLSSFDLCLNEGDSYTFKIELYRYASDPNPCEIEKSVSCSCSICPDDVDDWLTLTSTKGAGSCAVNECYVENTLNVPLEYPCYSHYEYIYQLDDPYASPVSSGVQLITSNVLSTYNTCIAEGETYSVTLKLYKGATDPLPCEIVKTTYCPITPVDTTACLPDCFDDPFIPAPFPVQFTLNNCPGCVVQIRYSYREACDTWYDIQITSIEKFNMPNFPTNACSACTDAEVYMQAIEAAVKDRLDRSPWPPQLNGECSIQWRISKASCWASWTRIIYDPIPEPDVEWKYITVNKPCNSDCCLRRMEVCKDSTSGAISITDLGVFNNTYSCDSLYYNTTDFLQPPSLVPCSFTFSNFVGKNGVSS